MVRLRRGLEDLGMNGFLRKMILLCDYHMACSFNCEPWFEHKTTPFDKSFPNSLNMSTPLLPSQDDFVSSYKDLHISRETAIILDDMRFLMQAILQQVDHPPSPQEESKLATTSTWIRDRILALPDGAQADGPLGSDYIYKTCRMAAMIYCRAIVDRTSLFTSCTLPNLNQLWGSMWRITLSEWKAIPGIFLWVILAVNPSAQDLPHGRFLKSMLKTSTFYMGLEHWEEVDGSLMGFVKLQRWLRGRERDVVVPLVEHGSSLMVRKPGEVLYAYRDR